MRYGQVLYFDLQRRDALLRNAFPFIYYLDFITANQYERVGDVTTGTGHQAHLEYVPLPRKTTNLTGSAVVHQPENNEISFGTPYYQYCRQLPRHHQQLGPRASNPLQPYPASWPFLSPSSTVLLGRLALCY
ncbi:hypothetical protein PM082_004848 [Marasmius tenuissimus]|nr:hypothetical protein PM082_004848 [Marasmius tenuissimus]